MRNKIITLHPVYEELLSLVVDPDEGVVLVVFLVQRLVELRVVLDPDLEVSHGILLVDASVVWTGHLHLLQ